MPIALARRLVPGLAAVGAAALMAAVVAACVPARTQPTPIIVWLTPSPGAATVAPSASQADGSVPGGPNASPGAVESPSPSIETTPVVVGAASESPGISEPGSSPATPVSPTACAGTANNKAFWAEVADSMSWPVYCPILPATWTVKAGSYDSAGAGTLSIAYAGPSGATLFVQEGAFCTSGATLCAPHTSELGTAALGDLIGTLDALGNGQAIYVNPGTSLAYALSETGLSSADFLAIARSMRRVIAA